MKGRRHYCSRNVPDIRPTFDFFSTDGERSLLILLTHFVSSFLSISPALPRKNQMACYSQVTISLLFPAGLRGLSGPFAVEVQENNNCIKFDIVPAPSFHFGSYRSPDAAVDSGKRLKFFHWLSIENVTLILNLIQRHRIIVTGRPGHIRKTLHYTKKLYQSHNKFLGWILDHERDLLGGA